MEVEVENPHDHVTHRSGHGWLDKVLPISALFVSFISILIAWHHGGVMQDLVRQNERLVQASSLPHITLEVRDPVDDAGLAQLNFLASNAGVGPADIRSIEMLLDGKAVSDSSALLKLCCDLETREYYRGPLAGVMLRPGEARRYLGLDSRATVGRDAFIRFYDAWEAGRITTRVCYCSVFDECWTRTSEDGSRPTPVGGRCPVPSVAYTR